MDTERNLLFGVLAFQADLIDAERFAAACSSWVAHKERPLADHLIDSGWITADDRTAIEHLMQAKLRRNDHNAQQSLIGCCGLEARQILEALRDTDIQDSIDGVSTYPRVPTSKGSPTSREPRAPDDTEAPVGAQRPADAEPTVEPGSRYVRDHLHARGGLGRVWRAHDRELGRLVALKELLPERTRNAELSRRFLAEARITGRLQHPGIVPVYDLKADGEGDAPAFYTMRFVQGETLSEAIGRHHESFANSSRDRIRLRELLGAFVSVCNAVAYAHSVGVIHRDLKGANVIVGNFGEVILLDWGLAKTLGDDEVTDDSADSALSPAERPLVTAPIQGPAPIHGTAPGQVTVQGQVLGTPAYMPPEQAEGKLEQMGPRSDVYSLGAMLYEILAGRPPFEAESTRDVLRQVIERPPTPPRRLHPNCPRALESVCLRALNKSPDERYGSANELAEEVRRWLADEPVSAYREPLTERAARWSRRHRTAVASVAALLLTALLATSVGLVVVQRERIQTEKARQRAEQNLQLARGAVDRYMIQVSGNILLNQPGLQPLRRSLLEAAIDYYRRIADEAGDDPASRIDLAGAHARQAQLRYELGELEEAARLNERALQLLVPGDGSNITDGTQLTILSIVYHNQGNLHRAAGDRGKAAASYQRAQEMRQRLVESNPANAELRRLLAADFNALATLQFDAAQLDAARQNFRQALDFLETLRKQHPNEDEYAAGLAANQMNLAMIHRDQGELAEAERSFQAARDLQEELVRRDPSNLRLQNDLIHTLHEQAMLKHFWQGDVEAAKRGYQAAYTRAKTLSHENPTVGEFRRSLATPANNLAQIHQQQGELDQARQVLNEAIQAWRRLVQDSPLSVEYRSGLFDALGSQAISLRSEARFEEAWKRLDEAESLMAKVRQLDPESPMYRYKHGYILFEMGQTQGIKPQWESARDRYQLAREVLAPLLTRSPVPPGAESTVLMAQLGEADATSRLGQYQVASQLLAAGLGSCPAEQRPLWQLSQAFNQVRSGAVRDGIAFADKFAPPPNPPGYYAHQLGCLLALAAGRAEPSEVNVEQLTRRAVQRLNEAKEAGFYAQPLTRHALRVDPDLQAIRDADAFQQLLREIVSKVRD